jgi:hypothetical protein
MQHVRYTNLDALFVGLRASLMLSFFLRPWCDIHYTQSETRVALALTSIPQCAPHRSSGLVDTIVRSRKPGVIHSPLSLFQNTMGSSAECTTMLIVLFGPTTFRGRLVGFKIDALAVVGNVILTLRFPG